MSNKQNIKRKQNHDFWFLIMLSLSMPALGIHPGPVPGILSSPSPFFLAPFLGSEFHTSYRMTAFSELAESLGSFLSGGFCYPVKIYNMNFMCCSGCQNSEISVKSFIIMIITTTTIIIIILSFDK